MTFFIFIVVLAYVLLNAVKFIVNDPRNTNQHILLGVCAAAAWTAFYLVVEYRS